MTRTAGAQTSTARRRRGRWAWLAVAGPVWLALGSGCLVDFGGPGQAPDASPGCGNGVLEQDEACDGQDFGGLTCQSMGLDMGELSCTAQCQIDLSGCHSCGNGELDGVEECDDGNGDAGDGCLGCRIESGWDCDGAPSVCVSICGDGIVVSDEECDDGGLEPGDGCTAECLIEDGWSCTGSPSQCFETCGDGVGDAGEECDDGNLVAGDGCSPSCRVEEGWECSAAPSTCNPECGDGLVVGGETCDDGNLAAGDGCDGSCAVEPGWECDFQSEPPAGCTPLCGDGVIVGGEGCDDGNAFGGDGCDGSCQIEGFSACANEPSDCICVVYVDVAPVPDARTGAGWSSALDRLEDALQQAQWRAPCEVWVAEGTYYTYQFSSTDRLEVDDDVALYGGFAGTETWRDQRDWASRPTVISAEQAGNPGLRVRTILRASSAQRVIVDGFTLSGALGPNEQGGALSVRNSSEVSVRNCLLTDNVAGEGGAIYVEGSTLEVVDSDFVANVGEQRGGAMQVENGGTATLDGCLFEGNTAAQQGGAISINQGDVTARSCRFHGNEAQTYGGAIRLNIGTLAATNVVFWANQGMQGGGAVSLYQVWQAPSFVNCTFFDNTAPSGQGSALLVGNGDVLVYNSILWGTSTDQIFTEVGSNDDVQYSDVFGGEFGPGNLQADPQFTDPSNGIFTLLAGSPCIDAADGDVAPVTDIDGLPRYDDPNVTPNPGVGAPVDYADIGAHERQP